MAFGSPWDKEIPIGAVASIVEAYMAVGINEISLSDASGMAFPPQVQEICAYMKKHYPKNMWWLHFHNTRGLAWPISLRACKAASPSLIRALPVWAAVLSFLVQQQRGNRRRPEPL